MIFQRKIFIFCQLCQDLQYNTAKRKVKWYDSQGKIFLPFHLWNSHLSLLILSLFRHRHHFYLYLTAKFNSLGRKLRTIWNIRASVCNSAACFWYLGVICLGHVLVLSCRRLKEHCLVQIESWLILLGIYTELSINLDLDKCVLSPHWEKWLNHFNHNLITL